MNQKTPRQWVVGLDLATHTGWAVRCGDGDIVSGVWDLTPPKGGTDTDRYIALREHLEMLFAEYQPTALAYEDTRFLRGGAATRIYFGLLATVLVFAREAGVPVQPVNVATLKKFATGKGNADKNLMVEAACRRWPGYEYESDDEADARWLVECAVTPPREFRRA